MSDKVVPFRRRRPTEVPLEFYWKITRSWHPQLRELMFPEYFKLDKQERRAPK
jgi:hypothetical protein